MRSFTWLLSGVCFLGLALPLGGCTEEDPDVVFDEEAIAAQNAGFAIGATFGDRAAVSDSYWCYTGEDTITARAWWIDELLTTADLGSEYYSGEIEEWFQAGVRDGFILSYNEKYPLAYEYREQEGGC